MALQISRFFRCLIIITLVLNVRVNGQIKSNGIKSGNLLHNGTAAQHWSPPPQFGGSAGGHNSSADAVFLNRTRTTMASGICFKEVPTVSLLRDRSYIPAGNGVRTARIFSFCFYKVKTLFFSQIHR